MRLLQTDYTALQHILALACLVVLGTFAVSLAENPKKQENQKPNQPKKNQSLKFWTSDYFSKVFYLAHT